MADACCVGGWPGGVCRPDGVRRGLPARTCCEPWLLHFLWVQNLSWNAVEGGAACAEHRTALMAPERLGKLWSAAQ